MLRLFLSMTKPAAPIPSNIPFLRASKGRLTSSTVLPIAWAPAAAKPAPTQVINSSLVESSALTMMIRSQRPEFSQSSATAIAEGVDAHALLTDIFGPLAPIYCAN